jgi:hypothetical protein
MYIYPLSTIHNTSLTSSNFGLPTTTNTHNSDALRSDGDGLTTCNFAVFLIAKSIW